MVACANPSLKIQEGSAKSEYRQGCFEFLGQRISASYIVENNIARISGGDMLLPIDKIINCDSSAELGLASYENYINPNSSVNRLWPQGRVPYVLPQGFPYMSELKFAISEWEKAGIKWEPKIDSDKDWVSFNLLPPEDKDMLGGRCGSALVGRHAGLGAHALNLRTLATVEPCRQVLMNTILHEMGHILGFMHEHQRSDRDEFITFTQDVSNDTQLQKLSGTINHTAFDYASVMLYPTIGSRYLRTKAGGTVPVNSKLSAGDIEGARRLYQNKMPELLIKPPQSEGYISGTPFTLELVGSDDSVLACTEKHLRVISTNESAINSKSSVTWAGTWPNCQARITPVASALGRVYLSFELFDGVFRGYKGTDVLLLPVNKHVATIDPIPDQYMDIDTEKSVILKIRDADGPYTCAYYRPHTLARKDSAGLIDHFFKIAFWWQGTAPECTAAIMPKQGTRGKTLVTLTIPDGNHRITASFNAFIGYKQGDPMIAEITKQQTTKNTPKVIPLGLTNRATLTCSSTHLSYTSTNNLVVGASQQVAWGGTWPNCTATVTPTTNATGETQLNFTLKDGSLSDTIRVDFTVIAAPTPPNQPDDGKKVVKDDDKMNENNENGQQKDNMNSDVNGQQKDSMNPNESGPKKEVANNGDSQNNQGNAQESDSQVPDTGLAASIKANKLRGKAPVWIELSGEDSKHSATEKIVQYEWSFGDGTTGRSRSFSKSYTVPGEYEVSLKVKTSTGKEDIKKLKIVIEK